MFTFASILVTICLVLIGLALRYNYLRSKQHYEDKQQKSDADDIVYHKYLNTHASVIQTIYKQILPFTDSYCSNNELAQKVAYIERKLPSITFKKNIHLDNSLSSSYQAIRTYVTHGEKLRIAHNTSFLEREKNRSKKYFQTLLSHPLDKQQVDAILHDDDNTLVIAGAGCGKTTTVQAKIAYLLYNKLAKPTDILVLSFAKKNADDLKEKLAHLGINCRTFHALAYQIIKDGESEPAILPPNEVERTIIDIHHRMCTDKTYLSSFNDFVLNGLRPILNNSEFKNDAAYIDYLKDSDFESIQGLLAKRRFLMHGHDKSMVGEFVKNGEHCYIANFLFLHDIPYSYETPFFVSLREEEKAALDKQLKRYKPTFTIYLNGYDAQRIKTCPFPQDHLIFIDHLPTAEYKDTLIWSDDLHESYRSRYIKSYAHEFKEKTIEETLISHLSKYGVPLRRKSNEDIYKILEEAYGKEIDAVLKLIQTFITLFKSSGQTFDRLIQSNSQQFRQDGELQNRNEQFFDIVHRIQLAYQERLKFLKKVDFDDLIHSATLKVKNNRYQHAYKYIIVDEFQDLSINRCKLLLALKKQRYCKLFAVGDDWQSIYRFSGSDLTLFNQFGEFFGHTVVRKIENTYRFAEPMISISSRFILKNPYQIEKTLRNPGNRKTEVFFEYTQDNISHLNQDLLHVLQKLYAQYGQKLQHKSMLLLGRYQHDINRIQDAPDVKVSKKHSYIEIHSLLRDIQIDRHGNTVRNNQLQLDKKIDFQTVHSAKGLEADIVILINCESGKYGFPAELSDDKVLNLLLSGDDQYPNSEERRVFYVAMTRAKEKFYFLLNRNKQSKFIRELHLDHVGPLASPSQQCERCGGELRFIKNISNKICTSQMYGCTNFRYGCDYTTFRKTTAVNAVVDNDSY
ncbi:DNA helicase-4 [Sphingobacterium nematocida]|uniref:DNA helicase-4 n=1 Tax=Sphingobacterium nematocida TaxID=1513896 RepID=A0A1T5CR21_9SPHI|nr:UvrD-helicase domain-containing protein [Sphingobacterium nematocida]SKB61922.1 DNA helicase-4 [Sphingobacterium nematocida]